ncbi:hypothetical protein [Georgenia sp. SUBG003]|uniref:hypothetical protein n=1 Tax=Georgenia sp. SUBG003 TaxID=1497974 RepID=UPI003AB33980
MHRLVIALLLTLFSVVAGALTLVVLVDAEDRLDTCNVDGPGVRVELAGEPDGEVNGYSGAQLANAAAIINAGADLGLSVRDQTIGVMTAMGESGLEVLDHGDEAGPDSRGLFQQRDNGAWGTLEQRMDPTASARSRWPARAASASCTATSPSRTRRTR